MIIHDTLISRSSGEVPVVWQDISSIGETKGVSIFAVHAYCFVDGKFVVVFNSDRDVWTPPGGGVEPGEHPDDAVVREVDEETSLTLDKYQLFGMQKVTYPDKELYYLRYACIGKKQQESTPDPDGDVTEVRFIDAVDVKQYFDWGRTGEYSMQRALDILDKWRT